MTEEHATSKHAVRPPTQSVERPVVVIGAGPAGLTAARAAKQSGAARVLIVDREPGPGGILNQCIHPGFGLKLYDEELTGPEFAARCFSEAVAAGVDFRFATTVLRLDEALRVTMVSENRGLNTVEAAAVILATGCRERARGVINIPGYRPAGVFCAGLAQKFVNIDGFLPGKRVVILGSGDIGLIMARRLTLQGAKVLAVIEAAPFVGGLTRNVVQCLHDFDIPLYLSHLVTEVMGKNRVEAVRVARVDESFRPQPNTGFELDCDTLLLSVGLIPENELAEEANVALNAVTNGVLVDQHYMTSVPGIFACGNCLHVHDLVDILAEESARVGACAASFAASPVDVGKETAMLPVRHDAHFTYALPHFVDGRTEVTFSFRVRHPLQRANVRANGFSRAFRFLQPNQMARVTVPPEHLTGDKEVQLWIEES